MRELITEIEVNAEPQRLWQVLTDLEAYGAWNPLVTEASGELREGGRLHVRVKAPGGRAMTLNPVVTCFAPRQALRWRGRLGARWIFEGEHAFEIEALGQGRVRFVHRERFRGGLVPLLWRSLDTRVREGFEAMNAALKARCESTS